MAGKKISVAVAAAGVVLGTIVFGKLNIWADDAANQATSPTRPVALNVKPIDASKDASTLEGEFVVHEWGTFTTFSGSDGVFLDFRPLAQEFSDLPDYVHDRCSQGGIPIFTKARLRGRVRMETPVTYFYTDRVRSVDVSVDFPKGLLTEYYPPVQKMLPPLDAAVAFKEGEPVGNSSLDWGTINLIPQSLIVPSMEDKALQSRIADKIMYSAVPHGANEHHYAQARATDSALVHVSRSPSYGIPPQDYFEKFLFYRGVGSFELPVDVAYRNDKPIFANRGNRAIKSVILIESQNGVIHATKVDQVAAGTEVPFEAAKKLTLHQLGELVKRSLIEEGLYEKEAMSMVNTWRDSWFTENGRRVLYIVPAEVTEELLPLHIQPAPQERLRVLVGRMEIMSPYDEEKLTNLVSQSIVSRAEFEQKHDLRQKNAPVYPVPEKIRDWERMTEPALVRISKVADTIPIQREAQQLLAQLRAPK